MKSERLQFSTLVRIGQSILCIAAVLALALVVLDMYQERSRDGNALTPGTENKEPSSYYFIDARV